MPTRDIAGILTGTTDATLRRIISPRYIMGEAAGRSRAVVWVNAEPLPGGTATGESDADLETLALGHVLSTATDAGISVVTSARLALQAELAGTATITVSATGRLMIAPRTLGPVAAHITVGATARLATGAVFTPGGDD